MMKKSPYSFAGNMVQNAPEAADSVNRDSQFIISPRDPLEG